MGSLARFGPGTTARCPVVGGAVRGGLGHVGKVRDVLVERNEILAHVGFS